MIFRFAQPGNDPDFSCFFLLFFVIYFLLLLLILCVFRYAFCLLSFDRVNS